VSGFDDGPLRHDALVSAISLPNNSISDDHTDVHPACERRSPISAAVCLPVRP